MSKELLEYFNGDQMAADVWKAKYAYNGEETPNAMHIRLAREFARIEKEYINKEPKKNGEYANELVRNQLSSYGYNRKDLSTSKIFNLFKDFKYLSGQGSVMSVVGTDTMSSCSNCFYIGSPADDITSIFQIASQIANISKMRGGVGLDISTLRPNGGVVDNSAKTSSGAVSFMDVFDVVGQVIGQNNRRAALMISMHVNHPDVIDFITVKRDLKKVTAANISIKVTDEFMSAVENNDDYLLKFPVDSVVELQDFEDLEYNTLHEYYDVSGQKCYVKKVKAIDVWSEFVKSNHMSAEPGLLYYDRIHKYSPCTPYEKYRESGTNPCGEITLAPYDSCRLMISNLYGYCNEPFTKESSFDFDLFYKHSYELTRLCDDLVDLEIERIQKIIDKVKSDNIDEHSKTETLRLWNNILEIGRQGRRLGVGFTALGDVVAAMGLRYGSAEALKFIEQLMQTKMKAELDCTIDLAILRGNFTDNSPKSEQIEGEPINDWYQFVKTEFPEQYERMCSHGRRNVSISTIAPTGSVSIMTGTTGGLEPLFKPFYIRRKKINHNSDVKPDFVDVNGVGFTEHFVLHPKFKEWMEINNDTTGYYYALESNQVTSEYLEKCFVFSPYYKSTAEELDWKERVATQSLLQKYITHSCSSTTNLPADVSEEDMSGIYLEGWKQGLKGITTYRDTCRDGIMVSAGAPKTGEAFEYHNAPKRPQRLHSKVIRFQNNYAKWVAFVGLYEGSPYELFTAPLKDLTLPNNVEVGEIVKTRLNDGTKRFDFVYDGGKVEGLGVLLDKETYNYGRLLSGLLRHGMPIKYVIDSINSMQFENNTVVSWKAGVIRALSKFDKSQDSSERCPECGAKLIKKEGCISCVENCGYSKCG